MSAPVVRRRVTPIIAPLAGANDLWRWAKANNEHGTVSLYEQDGDRWVLRKSVKV